MKSTIAPASTSSNQTVTFTIQKQIQFFKTLKQSDFTGKVVFQGKNKRYKDWIFYFYLGRFIYVTGGEHRVRRWERSLLHHNTKAYHQWIEYGIQKTCDGTEICLCTSQIKDDICWEYQRLCSWVLAGYLTVEEGFQLIRCVLSEVLFDMCHHPQLSYCVIPEKMPSIQLILPDSENVVWQVHQQFLSWQKARLVDRSPNDAPVIQQPEVLQEELPAEVYQGLIRLLNGHNTLRDVALKMRRDIMVVTTYLLPYIQRGVIELNHVHDLPEVDTTYDAPPTAPPLPGRQDILIACIDDSHLICQTMQRIITEADYSFVSIENPLRAIATLLSRKPDIIFLDLVMPNTNGYEICSQLRKISIFKQTPIIILTGNDGIVDRVRAKLVGSSDFLSKPVDQEVVLDLIQKYVHKNVSK